MTTDPAQIANFVKRRNMPPCSHPRQLARFAILYIVAFGGCSPATNSAIEANWYNTAVLSTGPNTTRTLNLEKTQQGYTFAVLNVQIPEAMVRVEQSQYAYLPSDFHLGDGKELDATFSGFLFPQTLTKYEISTESPIPEISVVFVVKQSMLDEGLLRFGYREFEPVKLTLSNKKTLPNP